jgi:hypothetical protein
MQEYCKTECQGFRALTWRHNQLLLVRQVEEKDDDVTNLGHLTDGLLDGLLSICNNNICGCVALERTGSAH